jgi:anti-sigma factor ChrR (cupin superfamily)
MKPHSSDEIKERISLYTLGALSSAESLSLEKHIAEGCRECRDELRAFEDACALIALSAPRVEPAAEVRERLFARLAEEKKSGQLEAAPSLDNPGRFLTVHAEEGGWQETSSGVFVKQLYVDRKKGTVTSLFKMLPGSHAPVHRHLGVEECIVLEGDFHVNDQTLGPGDYHRAEAGSVHQTLYTEKGNLLLIISPQEGFEEVQSR